MYRIGIRAVNKQEQLLELLDEFSHAVEHALYCSINCEDCKYLLNKIQSRYVEEIVRNRSADSE